MGYNISSKPAKPLSIPGPQNLGYAPLWRVVKAGGSEGCCGTVEGIKPAALPQG